MALNFEWHVQILDAKYWLAESNCSVTSKLCQLQWWGGGGGKSEMVDRDVLLRKTRDKLCDFPVSFEGRPAQCSKLCIRWTRCPRCLSYEIREEFDFPSLCNCGRNASRASSMTRFPRAVIWAFQLYHLPISL